MYAYVGGDPVNMVDPSGLTSVPTTCPPGTPPGTGCGTHYDDRNYDDWDRYYYDNYNDFNDYNDYDDGPGDGPTPPRTPPTSDEETEPGECNQSSQPASAQLGALGQGIGDAFSLGLYSKLWANLPLGLGETYSSQTNLQGYNVGLYGATGASVGRVTYAGTAYIGAQVASNGRGAVNFRNSLKGAMSGLSSRHPRTYSYDSLLAKYGSDKAVKAAAGRTNAKLNAVGGVGTVSGGSQMLTGDGCP